MAEQLDLRKEIDGAKIGRLHWATLVFLGLVTLFDGYDVFVPAYVIRYTMQPWGLQPSQAGLLVSSGLIGFMIGSLAHGMVADRIGRKPTLLAALFFACVCNLLTAWLADSFAVFLSLRLLTGIGLGVLLPLSVTMINEIVPGRSINMMVGFMMVGWSAGGILAALLGLALTPTYGWPILFWITGIVLLLVPVGIFLLPESPRFLLVRGRDAEARTVMARLAPESATRYAAGTFTQVQSSQKAGSIAALLVPAYRRNTLVVWLCSACSLFVIYGISTWVPSTMIERGESFGASFGFGAVLQFMAIVGGVVCGLAADRSLGRIGTMAAAWIVGALVIAGIGLINTHATNLLFIALAGFCIMGAQPVLNNFTAALYGTEIRSTGVGVELGVGRIGGILGPYVGGLLQQLFPGPFALYFAMAAAVAISAVSLLFLKKPASPEAQL